MRKAKGTIHVFTFKDGILARAAHDLQIRLEKFDIGLEGQDVRAEIQLQSLFVDGPVEDGQLQPDKYDAGKKAEVEKAMHGDVLRTAANPVARFAGKATPQGEGFSVSGDLQLNGKTAPIAFDVRKEGAQYRASFELQPSRWGIAQYKALLGAIRLKDVLRIECALTDA
jgi:polyisoprenoid-binding protein YceI